MSARSLDSSQTAAASTRSNSLSDELTCSPTSSNTVRRLKSNEQYNILSTAISSSTSSDEEEKQRLFLLAKDYQLLSSWLFKQQYFVPPVGRDVSYTPFAGGRDARDFFRSFHHQEDTRFENLYQLDNFCVNPISGLSGLFPTSSASLSSTQRQHQQQPYNGKDDTRGIFHGEIGFKRFFESVKSLSRQSSLSDLASQLENGRGWRNRLALLYYLAPLSKDNLWHTLHRYLSLIGILDKKEVVAGGFLELLRNRNDNADDADSEGKSRKAARPILIIVVDMYLEDAGEEGTRVPALGLFIQALDLPWMVVLANGNQRVGSEKVFDEMYRQMDGNYHYFPKANSSSPFHKAYFTSPSPAVESRIEKVRADPRAKMCFKKGFAHQNCFACSAASVEERESYSFGMWTSASASRSNMLNLHRALMKRCLPPTPTSLPPKQAPIILFDIRTSPRSLSRRIVDLPLLLDSSLYDFGSNIRFAEPWKHKSYSQDYLEDKLFRSDIFVGVHGAAFSGIPLMQLWDETNTTKEKKTKATPILIVEFTSSQHFCSKKYFGSSQQHDYLARRKSCWFGSYTGNNSNHFRYEHWVIEVKNSFVDLSSAYLSSSFGNEDLPIQSQLPVKPKYKRNVLDAYFIPPSVINQVLQAAAVRWKQLGSSRSPISNAAENTTFPKLPLLQKKMMEKKVGPVVEMVFGRDAYYQAGGEIFKSIVAMFWASKSNAPLEFDDAVISSKLLPFLRNEIETRLVNFALLQREPQERAAPGTAAQATAEFAPPYDYVGVSLPPRFIFYSAHMPHFWRKVVHHFFGLDDDVRLRKTEMRSEVIVADDDGDAQQNKKKNIRRPPAMFTFVKTEAKELLLPEKSKEFCLLKRDKLCVRIEVVDAEQ